VAAPVAAALSATEDLSRRQLPVWAGRAELLRELELSDTLVVMAETGSGKTTQIPQFLHEAGYGSRGTIGVTQPRRVAAITIAARVAREMGCALGGLVGYSVRFDDKTDPRLTKLKYITDGMMVREAIADPLLSRYSVILLDEVHERSVQTDVLCAIVKGAQAQRRAALARARAGAPRPVRPPPPPLKVVVMSATLEMRTFSEYFGGAPCLHVRGRTHAVGVYYALAQLDDYVEAAVTATLQVHCEEAGFRLDEDAGAGAGAGAGAAAAGVGGDGADGDILVFLTGAEEIEACARLLDERAKALPAHCPKLLPCPMYAALSPAAQLQALAPAPRGVRKAILATTIAETSLTVPGVRYVIDCGLTKSRRFHAGKGIDLLQVVPVSKAAARQRAGRAGRERPGKCFRLYTEGTFHGALDESSPAEILGTNLAAVVLWLKALGVADVFNFDFVQAPPRAALLAALEQLLLLGALDKASGELSEVGRLMARLPLEPPYARALLAAREHGCVGPMLSLAAVMSVEGSLFVGAGAGGRGAGGAREDEGVAAKHSAADAARAGFASQWGDLVTRAHALTAAHAANVDGEWCRAHGLNRRTLGSALRVRKQLCGLWAKHVAPLEPAAREPAELDDDGRFGVRRALTAGFFMRAAARQPNGAYLVLSSREEVAIHPSSCLFARKAPCVLFQELVLTSKRYIRELTVVDEEWLAELAPDFYSAE
jgi:HrpA-like RNA helicase